MQNRIEKMVWPSDCARMLGVEVGLICAAKKHLGIERRKVFPSEMETFFKQNRSFTTSVAYPKKAVAAAS